MTFASKWEKVVKPKTYELGLDSSIAVALWSWFLGELNVDMPAFKILDGSTIAELPDTALKKLPPDMTRNVGG